MLIHSKELSLHQRDPTFTGICCYKYMSYHGNNTCRNTSISSKFAHQKVEVINSSVKSKIMHVCTEIIVTKFRNSFSEIEDKGTCGICKYIIITLIFIIACLHKTFELIEAITFLRSKSDFHLCKFL